MDVKDLRTEPALSERNNDGSKYTQGGVATLQCNRNKSYQDIGSNPLAKAEGAPVRPCAVIGPDRVVPPPATSDAFLKKGSVEPWPSPDNGYRRPPDYSHRLHQNPARNISPRQTFQENMQRINVPPNYNAVRHSDSANFNHIQDRSVAISKHAKPNMAPEAKYCDVPYAINALANEPKNVRDSEMYVSSVNSQLARSAPHGWPPNSVNVNAPRTYSANEPYQYPQYPSCAGQRPPVIPMTRPHRTMQEDPAYIYPDHYYRDAIGRIKPYPSMKERCPQQRYEYVGNYAGQFHPPPPIQPIKYDIPKPGQTHPYPVYPHFKYLDNRVPDPTLEGYQRSTSHQPHYNLPFRTQVIHPTYAQVPGNAPQKMQPYPPDGSVKAIPSNKLHYDNNNKMYIDYENARNKPYPIADNYYVNEINRFHPLKNQMVMPNYSPLGMRAMPSQQYYVKDNTQMKPFEYMPTFRNYEPHLTGNPMLRHAPQFSPNTLAISPTDSSTSNDTSQTHGTSQDDCGYVSQSSTTSVRSIDSGIYRLPHEYYKRHDFRYGSIVGSSHALPKTDLNSKDSKQKQIDVRQFLQMWNEEEEEDSKNNNSKDIIIQTSSSNMANFSKNANTEDQLYVLGLVNVPSEELSKYEHIEKISKLPENIKGYNNLELFSRFEEAMESCNTTAFKAIPKEYHNALKDNSTKLVGETLPRPVSPLDVEAKISQSVIHKEVGCNFEIKPCSPKMLNVEIAAPAQNILGERVIEKVSNPLSKIIKSPLPINSDENSNCHTVIRQDNAFVISDNPSCKMIRSPFSSNNMDSVKTNYTLQDLEINSGVCLESLPPLDNEIELNFPEVNQQFINANKKDRFSTANTCHQSNLHEDSSFPDNKEDKTKSEKSKIMLTECDKTFTKLSKYRKSKTNVTNSSENKSKAVRTDSVIIKNPENIENKMLENSLNIPMNLSSQSAQWYDSPHQSNDNKDNDMALDFSLNKSGNDLPIIETEKDALIKQFEINYSHLSHDNVLPTDANLTCHESSYINDIHIIAHSKSTVESIKTSPNNVSCDQSYKDLSCKNVFPADRSYKESAYINDDLVNLKDDIDECIQTDPKTASKVQNNQAVENKPDVNSYEVIKSAFVNKDQSDKTTPVIDSTSSKCMLFENTELENKDHDTDQRAHTDDDKKDLPKIHEISEDIVSEELQASVKTYNTDENTVISNDNIDNDKHNLATDTDLENCENITITCTKTLLYKESEHLKNKNCPEEYSEVNKNELLITSQNENNFEHDEISASLEKLFRESDEEVISLPSRNVKCSSSVLNSKSIKIKINHQSKELHSPWIQKLLTHREGSCSNTELSQKGLVKSIFDPDEIINEHAQSDMKVKLANDMEIDHETIASTIPIQQSKSIIMNTTKDLTSDTRPSKSNALIQLPENDTDSIKTMNTLFDKIENKPKETKETLIEERDIMDVFKVCIKKTPHQITNGKKRNSEVGVNASKIKKRKLRTLKLSKDFLNCDGIYSTNVSENSKINNENCQNNVTEKKPETIVCPKSIYVLESINKKNLAAASSKNASDIVSDDKEEQKTEKGGKKVWIENITTNYNSNTDEASEMLNSSNTDFKLDAMAQHDLNEPSVENVSTDVSYSFALPAQQIGENSSKENTIESIFVNCNKDIDKLCTDDHIVLEKQSNLKSDSLPNNVFGICNEHQEENQFGQGMITKVAMNNDVEMGDTIETSNRCNIVQDDQNFNSKLHDNVFDNCTDYETDELKSLEYLDEDYVKKHCSKDADVTSGLLNNTIPVLKYVEVMNDSKRLFDSLSTDTSIVNQSEEELSEKLESGEKTKEELDKSKCSNTICKPDAVSKNNQNSCGSESSVSNKMKENENICNSIENFGKTPDSDINQMPKTSDSMEVCTDKDIIKKDPNTRSDCDSDNLTENLTGNDLTEITFQNLEKCKDRVISETLGNANIICKEDDIFQEDQHNTSSEGSSSSSSDNSIVYKIQETQSRENTAENINKSIAEAESNCFTEQSDTTNIQVDNIDQISQNNVCNLAKNTTNYVKREPEKNKIQECSVTNCEIESGETLEVCSTKNVEFDHVANEKFSTSLKSHSINVKDNYLKPDSENEIEEKKCTENKNIQENSNVHTAISSEETDCKNNSEPDSLTQENKNDNTFTNNSDSVSGHWIEDYNDQTLLFNKDNINATDDDYVRCEDNKDSLCDPVVENNLVELENHLSNIHNSETSIQDSLTKRRPTLKRSLSDSALNSFKNKDTPDKQLIDNTPMWPPKRQKLYEFDNSEQQTIDENLCNFIQNRRNSISSYYNAENVSFCILIDNDCILTEENEVDKICFAEVSEDCITEVNTTDVEDNVSEVICDPDENELDFSDPVMLGYGDEKSIQESWLDDVACVETVVSDDIVENADNDVPDYSRDVETNYDESGIFNSDMSEITHGVTFAVEESVAELDNTYRSFHNDDKIMLCDEEPQYTDRYDAFYSGQCLEKILSKSYRRKSSPSPTSDYSESILLPDLATDTDQKLPEDKENIFGKTMQLNIFENNFDHNSSIGENINQNGTSCSIQQDNTMHLPKSNVDNVFCLKKEDDVRYATSSSSPEVSSTTFEEKSSSILLKITNYNGSRVSEINEVNRNRPRCKFTESKDYSNSQGNFPKRPLITKAAQKYIPPLKESIRDLKVKLLLPQQRLHKLKQLKLSKSEPKVVKQNILTIPKKQKPKPNFEDVLKNIDKVQIKMHKQNSKKMKNIVPKVVIKKNLNGSHYTSSSSKDIFNPDLTGRKWQPWVFLERDRFIDNMAMTNKTKAVFSYRKNMYVLAEKFKKYKSVSNGSAKFIISQPKTGELSKGQLKYTIRLKHS